MKPRSRPSWYTPAGAAVGAAAAVLLAAAGPALARPSGGPGDAGSAVDAGSPTLAAPERGVFFSNLGLLESISREAANAIADSLALPAGSTVTLLARTPHEANWFVGNLLAEVLAARGYKVRVSNWGTPVTSAAQPAGQTPAQGAAPAGAQAAAGSPATPPPTQQAAANRPRHKKESQQGNAAESASAQGSGGADAGKAAADTTRAGAGKAMADGTKAGAGNAAADTTGAGAGKAAADTTGTGKAKAVAEPARANPDSAGAKAGAAPGGADRKPPAEEPPGSSPAAPAASAETPDIEPAAPVAPGELPAGNVLDLRVVEFGVTYSDIGRKLLFGPVHFTRVGGVFVQVTSLRGPAGDLRQVLSAERHRVDRLSGSQRALAEGASYPFSVPELKTPGLGRYIEPTVVVGIVGSLVYLFYANQSSK